LPTTTFFRAAATDVRHEWAAVGGLSILAPAAAAAATVAAAAAAL